MSQPKMACNCGTLPARWWQDKETLERVCGNHDHHLTDAALAHGTRANTLSTWRGKHGLPRLQPGTKPSQAGTVREDGEQWLLDALRRKKTPRTVEQLADELDVSPKRIREAAARLEKHGHRVELAAGSVHLVRVVPPSETVHKAAPQLLDGDLVRFGVVSDTHLCSKSCREDAIWTAYDRFQTEGIREVFHPGDLVAGVGIFRHQAREITHHTFEEQVAYAKANYPRVDGIVTRIISGNHDLEGEFGMLGADPVRAVAAERDDLDYLGEYSAWVELPNGARLHVLHPGGGGSYATSYRAQKIAEGYDGGEKPNATLFGHWHRRGDFEARNIQLLLCGTTEGSSHLARRYGLGAPAVGFHIVTCRIADDASIVEWDARWFPLYAGRTAT